MGATPLAPVRDNGSGQFDIERAFGFFLKREKALQILDVLLATVEISALGEHALEIRVRGGGGELQMLVNGVVRARDHARQLTCSPPCECRGCRASATCKPLSGSTGRAAR